MNCGDIIEQARREIVALLLAEQEWSYNRETPRDFILEKEGKRQKGSRIFKEEPERLNTILSRRGLRELFRSEGKISELNCRWLEIVGEEMKSSTCPKRLQSGILWIEVREEGLRYELAAFHQRAILGSIQGACPRLGVRELRFVGHEEE